MKIRAFGYARNDAAAAAPTELREVTIVAEPTVLRRIASHLAQSADEIERLGESFDHSHLQREWPEWQKEDADVVVSRPNPLCHDD